MYVDFMNLGKAYDRVNREAFWQMFRMYDWGGGDKLLSGVKSIYFNSLACVRVKGVESEWFLIDSGVRQGCIISPCLFNGYMDAVMKEVRNGMGRRGVRFL